MYVENQKGEIVACKCAECLWREECIKDFIRHGDESYNDWMYYYGLNCDDFTPLDPEKQIEEEYFTALQEAAELYRQQLDEMESDAV